MAIEGNIDFWGGFVIGILTFGILLIFLAGLASCKIKTSYKYVDIDQMTCIRVDGRLISCDWSDKE